MHSVEQPDTSSSGAEGGEMSPFTSVTLRATRNHQTGELTLDLDVWRPGSPMPKLKLVRVPPPDDGYSDGDVVVYSFTFDLARSDASSRSTWKFPDTAAFRYVVLMYGGVGATRVVKVAPVEDV